MRTNDLLAKVYVHEMQKFCDFLNSQKFRVGLIRKAIVLDNFVSREFHYFLMNTSFRDPVALRINSVKVDPEIENKSMYLQKCFAKKSY